MASLIWKPGIPQDGPAVVTVAGARVYHMPPGRPKHIRSSDLAAVTAALQAYNGTIASPGGLTLVNNAAAGAATRYFKVVATTPNGDGIPSAPVGSSTLNATPNETVSWNPVVGAASYSVLESTDNVTYVQVTASIGTPGTSFTYTGQATQAYAASGTQPAMDGVVNGPVEM